MQLTEAVGRETQPTGKIIAAFASIYFVWGSTFLAIRYAVEAIPPFLMAGVRFTLAGLLLYGWMHLRTAVRPTRQQWWAAAVAGLFLFTLSHGGLAWAEQRVESGIAALVGAMIPIWVVLLEWLRPGGTRPLRAVVIGIVVGFAGLVLLIGPGQGSEAQPLDSGATVVMVIGTLTWAIGTLYTRGMALPLSPFMFAGMQMLVGGVLLLVAGAVTGDWLKPVPEAVLMRSLLALLYLVSFGSILTFSAYVWLLRITKPARVATYAYVNPVVAVLLGWALAREPLTLRTLIAAAIIVAAVVVITTNQQRSQT